MLEPLDTVAVIVPDDLVGTIMSDLSSRRGRLLGTDKVGDDRTVIKAEVPQTELVRYAVDLRSSTHGAGSFTRTFAHYEAMPEDVAKTDRAPRPPLRVVIPGRPGIPDVRRRRNRHEGVRNADEVRG